MNLAGHLKRSAALGLGISVALTLALSTWLFRSEENASRVQLRQRVAVMHANALALSVAGVGGEGLDKRVKDLQRIDPRIQSVIVVSGMRLVASTRPEDAAPRQLKREEKALFDLANVVRSARETNRAEDISRVKVVQIEEKQPGHITVTVPYLSGGDFAGILQMRFISDAEILRAVPD